MDIFSISKKNKQKLANVFCQIGRKTQIRKALYFFFGSPNTKFVKPASQVDVSPIQVDGLEVFDLVGHSWSEEGDAKPIAVLFGFAPWKREAVTRFLSDYRIAFARKNTPWLKQQLAFEKHSPSLFVFWSMQSKKGAITFAEKNGVDVWRVEDGFLRSVGLGAQHIEPLSLAIDKSGIYFDRSKESDLENLINKFDAENCPGIIERAEKCKVLIENHSLTKYNTKHSAKLKELPPSNRRRVLVIGQVEDDASIVFGSTEKYSNNDLVRIAHEENEDAEVIYKPHPDVAGGHRQAISDPKEVADFATIITGDYDFQALLESVDEVYTLTSLAGFESLLRGKRVRVFGEPFYAGWGLTEDRHISVRRNVHRTLMEVFAAAYIQYPTYCVGALGNKAQVEHAILALILEKHGTPRSLAENIASRFDYRVIDDALCDRLIYVLKNNPYLLDETALFDEGQGELLELLSDPELNSSTVISYLLRRALAGDRNVGVFWKLRSIALSGEPSEALAALQDIAPENFALQDSTDLVACLTMIGRFDAAENVLNRRACVLPNTVSVDDLLVFLQAYEFVRGEQGRFGRKPVDPMPLWNFFRANLHWLRHDTKFLSILPHMFAHLTHFRMLSDVRFLCNELLGGLKAEEFAKNAKYSQVIVSALFKASKRPELSVQGKRQLAIHVFRKCDAKITSYYADKLATLPRTIAMLLLQMAIATESDKEIEYYKSVVFDAKTPIAKPELSEYKKTISDFCNRLVKARDYKNARSFLAGQKSKIPEEFYLHLVSNCYTHERNYKSAEKISLILLKKFKKNTYRRKLATVYANSGELEKASAWLSHAASAALSTKGMAGRRELSVIRDEEARVSFLAESSDILSTVAQPKLPKGVVFLGSFGCLNTISMVVPVLVELKRRGYAVVQLDEGMLRNEPTTLPWIDKHAGMIERTIHTDHDLAVGLKNEWNINWAGREVISNGINFYQAIFEIMTQKFRAFNFDINDPLIYRWFCYYLIRCDKALHACLSIHSEIMARGVPVRFINAGSHSAPFSVYRSFALKYASSHDVGFVHMGPAYENYYSNLKGKVATTVSLENLTKYPLYRLPFLARPDLFENWLSQDGLYERYRSDIELVLNHNRVGRIGNDPVVSGYENKLYNAKSEGRKIIGVYGKILCDLAVPFDGGPAHEDIADWLRHTVSLANSTSNLIVLKPHPHELRPEIARDLNEYWLDLIKGMNIPENVLILPHTGFNNQDLIKYLDLAVLWNGTSSLELCAQGIPVVMASHFGRHDYPVELIYPESRDDYERLICGSEWEKPNQEKKERAALLLKYMGTEEVCVPFRYSHRPVTNDPVGVPYWHMDEIARFLRDGDPHISKLADKFFA